MPPESPRCLSLSPLDVRPRRWVMFRLLTSHLIPISSWRLSTVMTSVLVMGGSKFVGLHTASILLRDGYQVTTLNRGRSEQPLGVRHLKCDRKDLPRLKGLLEKEDFDVVVDVTAQEPGDTEAMIRIFE